VRLLIVTHRYPPDGVTGVERIAEWTASGLRDGGDEVTVLTRRPSTAPSLISLERSERDGVDVLTLVGGQADHASHPGHASEVEAFFERVLVDLEPGAVLATHLLWHSPGYVPTASRLGIPTVVELHDFFCLCPLVNLQKRTGAPCAGPDRGEECARTCFAGQEGAASRWTARWQSYCDALRSAAALVAPSRYMADTFGSYAARGAIVHIVPNPVAIPVASVAGMRSPGLLRLVLIGGAVVPHKGAELLLEALHTARCGPVLLDVIGAMDPAYAKVIRERASRAPNLRLRLSGAFDNHLLPALLRNVDAVVIPSTVAESFSIVAREAFACGLPVVAADSGALPEAIRDGHNGLLFRMGSAPSLAACLERLAHEHGLVDRLASGARSTRVVTVEERVAAVRRVVEGALRAGPPPIPARGPLVVTAEAPSG
jgi:glycosyltransferase involved in cell wall biosynthesis